MKQVLVFSVSLMMIGVTVHAQSTDALKGDLQTAKRQEKTIKGEEHRDRKELRKLEGKDVSEQAKAAFRTDFGSVEPSRWERTANYDEAFYSMNGQPYTAYYDAEATLVGTTTNKSFSDLPAKAQATINREYPGYTKGRVLLFDDNEANETDMILYGTVFDDADNYFVELQKNNQTDIVRVSTDGQVSFFKKM